MLTSTSQGTVYVNTYNGTWTGWKTMVSNTDLNETVRNLAIDGRIGLDFNSTTKILSLYLGSNRIGTINVN